MTVDSFEIRFGVSWSMEHGVSIHMLTTWLGGREWGGGGGGHDRAKASGDNVYKMGLVLRFSRQSCCMIGQNKVQGM